jgi:hypothetical protein
MAARLAQIHGAQERRVQEIRAWLLRLEVLRYAPGEAARGISDLHRLRRELKRLTWPK